MSDPVSWAGVISTVVGTAVSVQSSRNAGKAQEIARKQDAKQEETAAADREIERRRNLVRALASQSAEAGALGLDPSTGSRRAIALDSATQAGLDSLTDRAMTNRRSATLRSQGRFARRSGNMQAAGTLIQGAANTANSWPGS